MISVPVLVGGGDKSKLQTEGRPGLAGLTGVWSLVQEFGAIFAGRAVVDRAVRADVVVFVAEGPPDALGLEEVGKQFAVEAFVAEAAVEALVDSVLPGAAGLDEAGLDARQGEPFLQEAGNKLRAVVAAHVTGRSVKRDQGGERRDDLAGAHPTAGYDIEAVVAVLVDDRQELHRVAALGGVEDHVDAPDVVDRVRFHLRIGPYRHFGAPGRPFDAETLITAHPLHRAQVAAEALPTQHFMHAAVAKPGMAHGQAPQSPPPICTVLGFGGRET